MIGSSTCASVYAPPSSSDSGGAFFFPSDFLARFFGGALWLRRRATCSLREGEAERLRERRGEFGLDRDSPFTPRARRSSTRGLCSDGLNILRCAGKRAEHITSGVSTGAPGKAVDAPSAVPEAGLLAFEPFLAAGLDGLS